MNRCDGRLPNQMRPVAFVLNPYGYASSSVICSYGNTKVLCSITLQQGTPSFIRNNKGGGWLTAEYAMLSLSTKVRGMRDNRLGRVNRRSIEISRLIGRVLRSTVNLEALHNQTIMIDCDVLQADGSTRTASITGASLALCLAEKKWLHEGKISQAIVSDSVCAV